jgi:hypothetical protein
MKETNKDEDKKLTQEKWLELCKYVHDEILEYGDLKFPRYLALRLRGLGKGQFMSNKTQKPQANYTYDIILYTFKICKNKLLQYLNTNKSKFTNEQHKINGIMYIIEQEINDVCLRLKNIQKSNEKTETLNLEHVFNEGAKYKRKETKINKNLSDLW